MNENHPSKSSSMVTVLSVMMFIQFFAWGAWFATMAAAMDFHKLGDFIGGAYGCAPIAAIFAPLFLGLIADRFFASEKVMGVLMLIGGVIMLIIPTVGLDASNNMKIKNDLLIQMGMSDYIVAPEYHDMISAELTATGSATDLDALHSAILDANKASGSSTVLKDYEVTSAIAAAVRLYDKSALADDAKGAIDGCLAADADLINDPAGLQAKVVSQLPDTDIESLQRAIQAMAFENQSALVQAACKTSVAEDAKSAVNTAMSVTGGEATTQEIDALATAAVSSAQKGNWMNWLILFYLLGYMPTLGLGNSIAFSHIPNQNQFPKIRVWGTIGWIVAGLLIGIMGWTSSFKIFSLGAASSLVLGVFCFFLPNTPPPLKGKKMDLRSLFMVDAFKLLADWNFFIFALCSTLICVPLAYYYGMTSTFLTQTGFAQAGATMTIGQMSEIIFMLLIPFFFRKLGVKMMIIVGMGCWVIRYLLFAFGAPDQVTWMLLLAIGLHGICYDFFFVTGFMYTDQKAPKEIRGQAQSLLVFLTQGVGMFFGYGIMAAGSFFGIPLKVTIGEYGQQITSSAKYVEAFTAASGDAPPVSFLQSFTQMFSRTLPVGLDQTLLSETMTQWSNFWVLPAIIAAAVMVLFAVLFWDKAAPMDGDSADV